jgi:hypothetical protein
MAPHEDETTLDDVKEYYGKVLTGRIVLSCVVGRLHGLETL